MPDIECRAFYPFFSISFAKYNWLLKKIHSSGGIPLRLQVPAGLWDELYSSWFGGGVVLRLQIPVGLWDELYSSWFGEVWFSGSRFLPGHKKKGAAEFCLNSAAPSRSAHQAEYTEYLAKDQAFPDYDGVHRVIFRL